MSVCGSLLTFLAAHFLHLLYKLLLAGPLLCYIGEVDSSALIRRKYVHPEPTIKPRIEEFERDRFSTLCSRFTQFSYTCKSRSNLLGEVAPSVAADQLVARPSRELLGPGAEIGEARGRIHGKEAVREVVDDPLSLQEAPLEDISFSAEVLVGQLYA